MSRGTTDVLQQNQSSDQSVILKPFPHQVGGHNCILMYDQWTICKPLSMGELSFYQQQIPHSLLQYIPKYLGVVNVLLERDIDGNAIFRACPIDRDICNQFEYDHQMVNPRFDLNRRQPNFDSVKSSMNDKTQSQDSISPCNSNCYRKQIRKMQKQISGNTFFILLENVVQRFQYPCIIDLKMGKWHQKFSIEDNLSMGNLAVSTIKLGIRLGGMQTYNVADKKFTYFDKYFGKTLDEIGLKQVLCQYFDNGITFRKDVCDQILKKLRLLRNRIDSQASIQFRACSILLIYEGYYNANMNSTANIDIRLIDFSHTISNTLNQHPSQQDKQEASLHPNNDFLYGLDNLLAIFSEFSASH